MISSLLMALRKFGALVRLWSCATLPRKEEMTLKGGAPLGLVAATGTPGPREIPRTMMPSPQVIPCGGSPSLSRRLADSIAIEEVMFCQRQGNGSEVGPAGMVLAPESPPERRRSWWLSPCWRRQ